MSVEHLNQKLYRKKTLETVNIRKTGFVSSQYA